MIDKRNLLSSTVATTSNLSNSVASGDLMEFDDEENDLIAFEEEKEKSNEKKTPNQGNDSLTKIGAGLLIDFNEHSTLGETTGDEISSSKRPLQRFFSMRRNLISESSNIKNEVLMEKTDEDKGNKNDSTDFPLKEEFVEANVEKKNRLSFFARNQDMQGKDSKVKNKDGNGEELLIDFDETERNVAQSIGPFRGLFSRIKKSTDDKSTNLKDDTHDIDDVNENVEDDSSENEIEVSNDDDDDEDSESSYNDDSSENETKTILKQKMQRSPPKPQPKSSYLAKFSPRFNRNDTKTFQQASSMPENNSQNNALHVKRLGDGVSQYLSKKSFHPQEKETKTYVNAITGFGNDDTRKEMTFTLEPLSDTDSDDPYHSGSLVSENGNQGKSIDDMDLKMMEAENNQNIFMKLGNRLNTFFEQHPEIIEYIDGPEGEDNRGFYHHVQITTNDDAQSEKPTVAERQLKELMHWKRKAIASKVRVEELEKELIENENMWKEKVLSLEEKLEKIRIEPDKEVLLGSLQNEIGEKPVDMIDLKDREEQGDSEKNVIINLASTKDLMNFEDSTTSINLNSRSAREELIQLNSNLIFETNPSENLIGFKDTVTIGISNLPIISQLNDNLPSHDNSSDKNNNISPNPNNKQSGIGDGNENEHAVNSDLSSDDVKRYSRQLLISEGFGVIGQKKLLASKVLVVGAGGIGSTVLPYLAAAGVGSITIVDHDKVDSSNLHRQIIHEEKSVSMNKAVSACQALKALNSSINCTPIEDYFNASNALDLVESHDVVVDATDNPKTRYLINDACVLSGSTPLVSGSAMGTEGQLTVYNYGEKRCCYRCLYPKINQAEGCKSCSDNGVLGPVPGLIGILQAMEVIKILTGIGTVMHDRLIMYDSLNCSFLNIKKPPPRKSSCPACGPNPTIKSMEESLRSIEFARGPDGILSAGSQSSPSTMVPDLAPSLSISCKEFDALRKAKQIPHILLDVRVPRQFEICSMENSINIPLVELESRIEEVKDLSEEWNKKIFCICRRGIASAEATRILNAKISFEKGENWKSVFNILGGLNSWFNEVDPDIPMY